MSKELGKIHKVRFGYGGYDNMMFGLTIELATRNGSVADFIGFWSTRDIPTPSTFAEWTENTRTESYATLMRKLDELLAQAKVDDVTLLHGVPVELTFNGNRLESWRILTEVL